MENIDKIIIAALKEDAAFNDITTKFFVQKNAKAKAVLIAKEKGIICGIEIFKKVLKLMDKTCKIDSHFKDGDAVKKGAKILNIDANAAALLSAERTALNFIQYLSGIATITHQFASVLKNSKANIFDTRKTLPAFRSLSKYAVRCGGGKNHRMNLSVMAIIKDNHLKLIKDLPSVISDFRKKNKSVLVEVECENDSQVQDAIKAKADIIMLDNMSFAQIKKNVDFIRSQSQKKYRPEIEVSGGVNKYTVKKFVGLDIERVSIGMLTHSSKALDLSLEITISQ